VSALLFEKGNISTAFGKHEQELKMQHDFAEVKRFVWEDRVL